MNMRNCDQCGQPFAPYTKRTRFCCSKCKDAWNNAHKQQHTLTCQGCGAVFTSPQRRAKYCSVSCGLKHGVPVKQCICVDCGLVFTFKGRTRRQHCDACTPAWESRRQMAWRSAKDPGIKLGVGSGGAQMRESNHRWNPDGAYHDRLRGQGYEAGYTRVCFEHWDKACAVNAAHTGIIDVHHINGVRNDNHPDNLVPLCRVCHARVHRGKYATAAEYVQATMAILPEECRIKIAELSGKPVASGQSEPKAAHECSQGQSIGDEISPHEAATPELVG